MNSQLEFVQTCAGPDTKFSEEDVVQAQESTRYALRDLIGRCGNEGDNPFAFATENPMHFTGLELAEFYSRVLWLFDLRPDIFDVSTSIMDENCLPVFRIRFPKADFMYVFESGCLYSRKFSNRSKKFPFKVRNDYPFTISFPKEEDLRLLWTANDDPTCLPLILNEMNDTFNFFAQ